MDVSCVFLLWRHDCGEGGGGRAAVDFIDVNDSSFVTSAVVELICIESN